MCKRSLTYEIIQFKVLTNRLLMACLRRQFEADHRPEVPESWHQLNQTIWPEVCITHLKACKQVLAKNNSRTKPSNLVNLHHEWHLAISNWDRRTITIWGWFWLFRKKLNHRRKLQENREYYLVSMWILCTPALDDVRALDSSPCSLRIWHPMQPDYFLISMMSGIVRKYYCEFFVCCYKHYNFK